MVDAIHVAMKEAMNLKMSTIDEGVMAIGLCLRNVFGVGVKGPWFKKVRLR